MTLSIIIPCFNESLSIKTLIKKCLNILDKDIEILIVDNGSTDDTFEILKNSNLPANIIPIKIEKNIGYGNGIIKGLEVARGIVLSWTHADLQTDPKDVIDAFKKHKDSIIEKRCIVKGRRINRNIIDSFFTFGMSIYCYLILGIWINDINAQPKIFHSSFLSKFNSPPKDFSLDLYVLYYFKINMIGVKTYPVFFNKRKYGEAKGGGNLFGKIKLIKRTFIYINELRKKIK